ncbi:MAG: lipase maturation factor family protein [Verrucomicrobia bacterium]|nr:lipase maturation factor family protein [Verrucomicrobiota bacterium]
MNDEAVPCPEQLVHSTPPAERPLLIYDGDCGFCARWIAKWQQTIRDKVDIVPFQSAGARFSEDIPVQCFRSAMRLIEPDGRVYSGAEAVLRALSYGAAPGRSGSYWCYQHVPGFGIICRAFYDCVAKHRELALVLTRALWGRELPIRSTYYRARHIFLRGLGLVYLIAFVSFWVQADGLVGAQGILPVAPWLDQVRERFGVESYWLLPTLCWFNASDWFLHLLCAVGTGLSVLLIFEIAPVLCLVLVWLIYLSLAVAGQTFTNFQWDYLLLETGFFSIFLAPLRWWPSSGFERPFSPWAHFLLRWLLFRLMFMSGVVKLSSGDPSWLNLSALHFHYWTQPLPTPLAWWANQLPGWFQEASVLMMFMIELVAPFLLFFPRRLRLLGAASIATFQILIALTGNYCFFNLLTIILCVLVIDDAVWPVLGRKRSEPVPVQGATWSPKLLIPVTAVVLLFSWPLLWESFFPEADWPPLLGTAYAYIERFRSLNSYGLFRVMTTSRPEIEIEGSRDGVSWQPYTFKYKIDDPHIAPPIVAPHQPRVDWQMWFAALSEVQAEPWFTNFLARLLQGSPPVLRLLKTNPFPDSPPRYIRAKLFEYRFTTAEEKKKTGAWWNREEKGLYCPVLSLREGSDLVH